MALRPITIGPRAYASHAAAIRDIRPILHETPLRTPLTGEAYRFIRDLLDLHPQAAQKIGPGLKAIEVRQVFRDAPKPMVSRGFVVVHPDDSTTEFSYRVCVKPELADA